MPTLIDLGARLQSVKFPIETWQRVRAGVDPLKWTQADLETVTGPRISYVPARSLAKAQGIRFLCPLCWVANKGPIGTHSVQVGFDGRAPPGTFSCDSTGKDSRWIVTGTGLADLTLRPSILLSGPGCGWHGYVTKGQAA